MRKLNLNDYTDDEIVSAFFDLRGFKFLSVMNGVAQTSKRMEQRGKILADNRSQESIDDAVRNILGGEL